MGQLFVLMVNGQDCPSVAAALTEALGTHRANALELGREGRQQIAVGDRMDFHAPTLVYGKPRHSMLNLSLGSIHLLPGVSDRGIFG